MSRTSSELPSVIPAIAARWFSGILLSTLPSLAFAAWITLNRQEHFESLLLHIELIGLLCAVACTTLVILNLIFGFSRWMRVFISVMATAYVAAITIFYSIHVIGLTSWGRLPTLSVVTTYFSNFKSLLGTLGVDVTIAALVTTILLALLGGYFAMWFTLSKPYASRVPARVSKSTSIFHVVCAVAVALFGIVAVRHCLDAVLGVNPRYKQEFVAAFLHPPPIETRLFIVGLNNQTTKAAQVKDQIERSRFALKNNSPKPSGLKNVILVTVDALRPDRMSVYGHNRETTPWLNRMRDQGLLQIGREARAACPESTCGLLSLLSGKQPHELVEKNFGLGEVLRLNGYKRVSILSGDHTNYYGLRNSYGEIDHYVDGTTFGDLYVNDDAGILKAIEQLNLAETDKKYFIHLHLMSAHGLGNRVPEHSLWLPQRSTYAVTRGTWAKSKQQEYANYYDNGVRRADAIIEKSFELLRDKGYWSIDSSIALITADHGESLGEHGVNTHVETVFDSVLRIPWLWLGKARLQQELSSAVIQADFAPTVLTELGIEIPRHWSGVALQRPPDVAGRVSYHLQFPEVGELFWSTSATVKRIHNAQAGLSVSYDLRADPNETQARVMSRRESSEFIERLRRVGLNLDSK